MGCAARHSSLRHSSADLIRFLATARNARHERMSTTTLTLHKYRLGRLRAGTITGARDAKPAG